MIIPLKNLKICHPEKTQIDNNPELRGLSKDNIITNFEYSEEFQTEAESIKAELNQRLIERTAAYEDRVRELLEKTVQLEKENESLKKNSTTKFKIGDKVKHSLIGEIGTVKEVKKRDTSYFVEFENVGDYYPESRLEHEQA